MPAKKRKPEPLLPLANEPLSDYVSLKAKKDSFWTITISSLEEQEESMQRYWASITPRKRLHHLFVLACMSYGLTKGKLKNPRLRNEIIITSFDEPFL
jgi:NDP-sugar pyrophosphorylase family protein